MRTWPIKSRFLRKSQIHKEPVVPKTSVVIVPSAKEWDGSESTLSHFGCSKQPFADTYDPDLFFLSSLHHEAVTALIDAVESNLGLSALIAGPGEGKTTLLYRLLECYSTAAHTAFLPRSCGSASALKHALLEELQRMLENGAGAERRVLIVLDEAHKFTFPELEVVRTLSAFESPTSKLLHFMLAGRAELAAPLSRPPLVDLKHRITVVDRDLHLSPVEAGRYINHRLKMSGYAGPPMFSCEALREIVAVSRGVPRQINGICASAMSRACELDVREITGSIIRDISTDPTFQLPSSPATQVGGASVEGRNQAEARHLRPLVITTTRGDTPQFASRTQSGRTSTAGRSATGSNGDVYSGPQAEVLVVETPRSAPTFHASSTQGRKSNRQRIRLPRINPGSYQAGLAAGLAGVAVAVIGFLLLCIWTFGVTSHGPADASVRRESSANAGEHQTVAGLPVANPSSPTSSLKTKMSEGVGVRSPLKSSDTSHQLEDEQIGSSTTIAFDDERATLNKPADPRPVHSSVETSDPDSDVPPQLAVLVTSDLQMPSLSAPGVIARIPISVPAAPTGGLLNPSETTSPQVVKMVRPNYPSKARKQKIYGEVVVTGVVGADGKLKMITTSGPAQLEEAALKAAQEWRYQPPTLNGNPVEATARIVFNFSQPD